MDVSRAWHPLSTPRAPPNRPVLDLSREEIAACRLTPMPHRYVQHADVCGGVRASSKSNYEWMSGIWDVGHGKRLGHASQHKGRHYIFYFIRTLTQYGTFLRRSWGDYGESPLLPRWSGKRRLFASDQV